MSTQVLIADDHQVVIDGLSALLNDIDGYQISGTAKNGWEVIEHIDKHGLPDILLMDISMPVKDGIETMEYLQEKKIDIKVIILSMHLSASYARKLLGLGVKGYLQKDCDKSELIAALDDVKEGSTYLSKNMTEILVKENTLNEEATDEQIPKVSEREMDILKLLLEEMSSRQIAEKLGISFNTVETHRKHLLNKFAVKSTVGLIRQALRSGILD